MAKLVSVAVERPDQYIAVDDEGQVWRGELKRQAGGYNDFIGWKPVDHEFLGDR